MFSFMRISLFVFLIINFLNVMAQNKPDKISPPKAAQKPKELTIHDHTRIDNYYWLNERNNPEVIEYLNAENKYTQEILKPTEALQEKLFNEIVGRIKQIDESVPYLKNGYYYYTRFEEGKEYPIYCRKKGSLDNQEEIMLDVNEISKGYSYYQVGALNVSPDNRLLAFAVDTLSRYIYNIYIKDLITGEIYPHYIEKVTPGSVWANDNKSLFYSVKDETLRPFKVLRHRIDEPQSEDIEVYAESDPTFNVQVYKEKLNKYIFIVSYSTLSTEFRFIEADKPEDNFKVIIPRERDHLYSVNYFNDYFFIRTNKDALNFKLVKIPVSDIYTANWTEVIPHSDNVLLEGMEIFRDYFVIVEREKGLRYFKVKKWNDESEYRIDFGEETYSASISINEEFDTDIFRFGFTSLTTPNSIYDFNLSTKERILLKQDEILGGFDPNNYYAERHYAKANDGALIPISLVYNKSKKNDGNNPLLLYGYGSYGASTDASFNSARLSLLDRGFIFAIAHVRGGQEMGRNWYEQGKLFNKKNTFTDFINCAEYLIEQNYTSIEKLFAQGGSAGGLLMGAIVNMRPDLFKGVIAAVPFVDVITTMLDESIPLTTSEYDEWGNPNQKDYYDYMLSYSPYDNVEAKNYPNLLVLTGLHDSQVQYWEPAKWVAKLREMKTDDNLLLLHTNMDAGHGGASGRFRRFKETALQFAFLLNLLGIDE